MDVGIKNFRGYRFLLGPEQLLLSRGVHVSTPEEYRAWHTAHITSRGADPWDSPEPIEAYINHGRWVADCRWCNTGMLTRPAWGVAYCAECGARYCRGTVSYPGEFKAAEAILLVRVRREQQNWDSTQSIASLAAENLLAEVAVAS